MPQQPGTQLTCGTPRAFPNRFHYLIAAVGWTLMFVYGSLAPFEYHPISLPEAIERFGAVRYLSLSVYARADFVANALLFIPVGFLWLGVVDGDRRNLFLKAAGVLVVAVIAGAAIVGVEFAQLWFPRRTVSQNDMFAEAAGTLAGVLCWLAVGRRATSWLRGLFSHHTDAGDWRIRLLQFYALGLAVYAMLPLDVVISPEEIRRKVQEGRISLVPFTESYGGLFQALWQISADVALFIPIGMLMRVAWVPPQRMRSAPAAMALTLGLAAAIEFGQIFIFTRYASVTDVIIACLGGLVGVAACGPVWRSIDGRTLDAPRRVPAGLVVVTIAYALWVVATFWYPFDFVFDTDRFMARWNGLIGLPFVSYYWGSEYNALSNLLRSVLMFVPIGAALRYCLVQPGKLAGKSAWLMAAVPTFALGVVIESGQALTNSRTPDSTDVLLYTGGALLGWVLLGRLLARARES